MRSLLIIDDHEDIREGLRTFIPWHELGFETVLTAADGENGLAAISRGRPDLVITDVRMPGISGLELIRHCTDMPEAPRFIIVSGYDDFPYVREALQHGVEDYLLKPVDRDELRATVKRVISRYRGSDRSKQVDGGDVARQHFLGRLLERKSSSVELRERAKILGIELPHGSACVVAFEGVYRTELYGLLRREISDGRGDALLDPEGRCIAIIKTSGTPDREGHDSQVSAFTRKTLSTIGGLDCPLRVGVGTVTTELREVPEGYRSAVDALTFAQVHGESVTWYQDTFGEITRYPHRGDLDLSSLREAWATGDQSTVLTIVDRLRAQIGRSTRQLRLARSVAVELYFALLGSCMSSDREASPGTHQDANRAAAAELRKAITWCSDGALLLEKAKHAVMLRADAEGIADGNGSRVVRSVIDRVAEHPDEDVSLQSIAGDYNLSPAYLGRLFHAETGEFYNDYVTELRLARARKLLRETHLRAAQIAEIVGYGSNAKYFFTLFKRRCGVTPLEYRRSTTK